MVYLTILYDGRVFTNQVFNVLIGDFRITDVQMRNLYIYKNFKIQVYIYIMIIINCLKLKRHQKILLSLILKISRNIFL